MSETSYKTIVVRKDVYDSLKRLGQTGDSFNDVISALVADAKTVKQEKI
jgi:predicted CopG family antitoxin